MIIIYTVTKKHLPGLFLQEFSDLVTDLERYSSFKSNSLSQLPLQSIHQIMLTIKKIANRSRFDNLYRIATILEELFSYLIQVQPSNIDFDKFRTILVITAELFKIELVKIKKGSTTDTQLDTIIVIIKEYLNSLKIKNPTSQLNY